jgi:hypothetical protein
MNIQTVSTSTTNNKTRYLTGSGDASVDSNSVAFSSGGKVTNTNSIESIFETLKNDWVRSTRFSNSLSEINDDESLKKIIGLGQIIVPLILKDLKDSPKHWFYALKVLTRANPIKKADAGNLEKMKTAWLSWADKNGVRY